jgi:large subunit ribosomal protein L10
MDRQAKENIVTEIRQMLDKASGLYITDFHGLTVEQTNELRNDFFEAKVDYKVVKNTLLRKALTEEKVEKFSNSTDKIVETLKGQTGIIFAYDDPVSPAKILKKHFDKIEKPKLKIAVIEDIPYDSSRLGELATLPSKQDIISSIVGSLHAPISGIVNAVSSLIRDLASVIEEAVKAKENK